MAMDEEEPTSGASDSPEMEEPLHGSDAPGRLIDDLVDYVRSRRGAAGEEGGRRHPLEDEDLLRTVLRHLRRNPIPASLLGFSLTWLLLASEEEDEELVEPGPGYQLEDEILQQAKGGLAYTNARLREVVDRYPWAAAATMVGGGLLAAFLLPERRRRAREAYVESEIGEEPIAGEGFDFEGPEER